MHDLIIRGGTIVDGTGASKKTGDIAIDNGMITAMGKVGQVIVRSMPTDSW